jgi:triacylglycerol lipase
VGNWLSYLDDFYEKNMLMRVLFVFLIWGTLNSCTFSKKALQEGKEKLFAECVILLHGMGRTKFSMFKLEEYLSRSNYRVVNFGYPSTDETIEQIARTRIPDAVAQCQDTSTKKIHFVTHSLGGVIVRQYLQTHTLPVGSRVVMLSPPNQGSEIPDHFKNSFWYRWSTGPAGQQLTTDKDSLPNRLKLINVEVGVIAGTKSIEPWFSSVIPGKDDGKVSVKRTQLDEMKDFLAVPHTHTFIMWSSEVLRQIENFLKHGKFDYR